MYTPKNFFLLFGFCYPKNPKIQPMLAVFQCFRHGQDIHDLKCKNILIIDEYDSKNIDQGNLVQLFMFKDAVFCCFLD